MSFTLRWGILATGWIAETFSKDLLTNPATRDVSDVAHRIVAVSSSRDAQKARDFLTKIDGPQEAKTYGSYAELVADPDVDIIYVATPHSHHFQNAMLALRAGKHVLCEKALSVTAEQARRLVATAREKNLFFMEAVWTRYQPLSLKVRELDHDTGRLSFADSHRMVNPDLAGGALLDLGIYSLTWVEIVECPLPKDESRGGWGHGFFWEADEAARCVRDGKVQSEGMPWEESVVIMEVMDEALRQGGVEYPALITSHEFDPESSLNTGR
ncbi:hypothetical protein VdG1_06670 [Verticillium dahliae VDG1]|nr:hypothetical protein VdG1_06670 [Verticillium dahliae VDG1]